MTQNYFQRNILLLGDSYLDKISNKKVIVFGIGGVGSWCAESLVRSGISNLTIVDFDSVSTTNINRQIMATSSSIGCIKVDILRKRLLDINPMAEITALKTIYNANTKEQFNLSLYDYVVDCIDSLKDKILLVMEATRSQATLFSSMGSALKMNISHIQTAEFWKTDGCRLAAIMRKRMRQQKLVPYKKFICVYSPEVLNNLGKNTESQSSEEITKTQINGSMVHITASFGLRLTELIIKDIIYE